MLYFGTLALGRLAMGLVTAFVDSGPGDLQFKLTPNSIGTTFGTHIRAFVGTKLLLTVDPRVDISAILVIVWYTYRNKRTRKLSAVAHVLVAESTIYFLVMVAAQIYIQLSFNLIRV